MIVYFQLRFYALLTFFIVLASNQLAAQQYILSSKGSKMELDSRLAGVGSFKAVFTDFAGNISFNPANLKESTFDITIKTNNMHTGNQKADNLLRSAYFFNTDKFATIKIKSTSITKDLPNSIVYQINALLTIKGIAKPVKLQLTATPIGANYLFRGSFSINRLSYNIGDKGDMDDKLTFFVELKALIL